MEFSHRQHQFMSQLTSGCPLSGREFMAFYVDNNLGLKGVCKAGCQEQEKARRKVIRIYTISSSLQIPPITSPLVF
jgi:hypothetical protein